MHRWCSLVFLIVGAAFAVGFFAPGVTAHAEDPEKTPETNELVAAGGMSQVLSVAKSYGSAELKTASTREPQIVAQMGDSRYVVDFYDCGEAFDGCKSISFVASWEVDGVSHEDINTWNRTKRFGKAFIDTDGSPTIKLPVNLDHGVTAKNLDDTFDWWRVVMRGFRTFLKEAQGGN